MITTLTARDFTLEEIDVNSPNVNNEGKKMVLLIKAAWCPHCVQYYSTYEKLSDSTTDFKFYVLEQTNDEALIRQWGNLVHSIYGRIYFPTLMVYSGDGTPIRKIDDRSRLKEELASI